MKPLFISLVLINVAYADVVSVPMKSIPHITVNILSPDVRTDETVQNEIRFEQCEDDNVLNGYSVDNNEEL